MKFSFFAKNHRWLLIVVLLLAVFTRFWRLDVPHDYVFDEVYHAFTAQEMAFGHAASWEWWNTPPKEFAYEWSHPPLAKEIMQIGVELFSYLPTNLVRIPNPSGGEPIRVAYTDHNMVYPDTVSPTGLNPFGWRFMVALFSVGIVGVLYLLGATLFSPVVGLFAAFLATFDGLLFVMGRVGMNDTFFLFFQLGAFLMFVKSHKTNTSHKTYKLILTGIFLGLALASKWTAVYGILLLGGVFLVYHISYIVYRRKKSLNLKSLVTYHYLLTASISGAFFFLILPIAVYLICYLPFFTSGHTWSQFVELQQQMWWYHTSLKATHTYQSKALSWPLMLRSVWLYVGYKNDHVANIYALGNPAIWWGGVVAIAIAIAKNLKSQISNLKKDQKTSQPENHLTLLLVAYFAFFLPWIFSPRIMFLYHYMPSLSFLILILSYGLVRVAASGKQGKIAVGFYLLLVVGLFMYFYPHLSGVSVSRMWAEQYFWLPGWK